MACLTHSPKLKKLGMIMRLGRFAWAVREAGGNVSLAAIQPYVRSVADGKGKAVAAQMKEGGFLFAERVGMTAVLNKALDILQSLEWEKSLDDISRPLRRTGSGPD